MADSSLERVRAAFAGVYEVTGEAGRGGMATVYLARELKHQRPVALKVLRPEVASAVGPARFVREVAIVAQLQHPHILTLIDSGVLGGFFYYAMPQLEGETLRDLMEREGPLPISQITRVTDAVGSALEYAHRHGVIHRDIKPENILLHLGEPMLADFGIALVDGESTEVSRLTESGISLGTPAYMSPEQAVADPQLDARSDQYSLACVVYEMLAGQPPFAGSRLPEILGKQLSAPPPPIGERRSVSAGLEAVVRRALAKAPDERYATVGTFAASLRAASAPGVESSSEPVGRPRSRRVALAFGAAAVAVAVLLLGRLGVLRVTTPLAAGTIARDEPLIVAEFEARGADSILAQTVTDAFRIDLARSTQFRTLDAGSVGRTLERMGRPARTPLDAAIAREIAAREGVKAYLVGTVSPIGAGFLLAVQLLATDSSAVVLALRETADDAGQIIRAVDRLSRRLREQLGESLRSVRRTEPLGDVTTRSLEALERYSRGFRAADQGDSERAVRLLEEAIALDTGFAMAFRKLASVRSGRGATAAEVADGARQAYLRRDRLPHRERLLATAYYFEVGEPDRQRVIGAYRSLLDAFPHETIALNNLANTLMKARQYPEAEVLLRRAARLEASTIILGNLLRAQVAQRLFLAAESTLAQYQDAFPGTQAAWLNAAALARARGDYPLEQSIHDTLARIASTPARRWSLHRNRQTLALIRGRLAEADRESQQTVVAAREAGRAIGIGEALIGAAVDIRFRGRPAAAAARIQRHLAQEPLGTLAVAERPYLDLVQMYAEAGRADLAAAILQEYEREVPDGSRQTGPRRLLAAGSLALAQGRTQEAVSTLRRYREEPPCGVCGLFELAVAYDAAGDVDSAIAAYRGVVEQSSVDPDDRFQQAVTLGPALHRLGVLYERRGARTLALDAYQRLAILWRHADEELQPTLREARARAEQLGDSSAAPGR